MLCSHILYGIQAADYYETLPSDHAKHLRLGKENGNATRCKCKSGESHDGGKKRCQFQEGMHIFLDNRRQGRLQQ